MQHIDVSPSYCLTFENESLVTEGKAVEAWGWEEWCMKGEYR